MEVIELNKCNYRYCHLWNKKVFERAKKPRKTVMFYEIYPHLLLYELTVEYLAC